MPETLTKTPETATSSHVPEDVQELFDEVGINGEITWKGIGDRETGHIDWDDLHESVQNGIRESCLVHLSNEKAAESLTQFADTLLMGKGEYVHKKRGTDRFIHGSVHIKKSEIPQLTAQDDSVGSRHDITIVRYGSERLNCTVTQLNGKTEITFHDDRQTPPQSGRESHLNYVTWASDSLQGQPYKVSEMDTNQEYTVLEQLKFIREFLEKSSEKDKPSLIKKRRAFGAKALAA